MTLKNILIGNGFALLLFFGAFIPTYWYLEPGYAFTTPAPQVVHQTEGTSVAINVPIEDYVAAVDNLTVYTQVTDTAGNVVQRTPSLVAYPNEHYKVITYRKLPVGVFDIILCVEYKANPIKWQITKIPLGVLHVTNKDKK